MQVAAIIRIGLLDPVISGDIQRTFAAEKFAPDLYHIPLDIQHAVFAGNRPARLVHISVACERTPIQIQCTAFDIYIRINRKVCSQRGVFFNHKIRIGSGRCLQRFRTGIIGVFTDLRNDLLHSGRLGRLFIDLCHQVIVCTECNIFRELQALFQTLLNRGNIALYFFVVLIRNTRHDLVQRTFHIGFVQKLFISIQTGHIELVEHLHSRIKLFGVFWGWVCCEVALISLYEGFQAAFNIIQS